MAVSINTTIQNRAKAERLAKSYVIPKHHLANSHALQYLNGIDPAHYQRGNDRHALLYSIGMTLLNGSVSEVAEKVLKEYETELVLVGNVPDCPDILGSVYQYLNTRQENLLKGSFYTGPQIAAQACFSSGLTLLQNNCSASTAIRWRS